MRGHMKILSLSGLVLACATGYAADLDTHKVEGKVAELQGVSDRDASLRVMLAKTPPLCGNAFTYAYLSQKDDNYDAMVELLLLAKSSNAPVMLLSQKDSQGRCQLLSVTVK
jgi:hypothetical protein